MKLKVPFNKCVTNYPHRQSRLYKQKMPKTLKGALRLRWQGNKARRLPCCNRIAALEQDGFLSIIKRAGHHSLLRSAVSSCTWEYLFLWGRHAGLKAGSTGFSRSTATNPEREECLIVMQSPAAVQKVMQVSFSILVKSKNVFGSSRSSFLVFLLWKCFFTAFV